MTGALSVDVGVGVDAIGPAAEWNALVARSPGGSFFQSAEWIATWWRELAGEPELAVARVRHDGLLVGAAALARCRLPVIGRLGLHVRSVTNAGAGLGGADHAGFPIAGDAPGGTEDVLWEWCSAWHASDSLVLANLSPASRMTAVAARELVELGVDRCPVTRLQPGRSFDEIRAGWTKNRRKTLSRKLRNFADAGGAFEWVSDPARVLELLPTVFALHRARREELGDGSRFGHDSTSRAFHSRLIQTSNGSSGTWVQVATVDGRVVGVLYGFQFGTCYSVFQSGWDPAWSASSLGLIQYAEALRHVADNGGSTFDMCRGDDAYKLRFASEVVEEPSYARLRGVRGQMLARRAQVRARRNRPVSALVDDHD